MEYKKWECVVCGWTYDEEKGHPEDGIEPGTRSVSYTHLTLPPKA